MKQGKITHLTSFCTHASFVRNGFEVSEYSREHGGEGNAGTRQIYQDAISRVDGVGRKERRRRGFEVELNLQEYVGGREEDGERLMFGARAVRRTKERECAGGVMGSRR